ncbi:unnamed protein product [Lupinus luteus]|uniref:Uncharacterized protein n=1 Tax=Lupinus luteus TaxID=3873 RepID=A0AAV1YIC7_LUPLU
MGTTISCLRLQLPDSELRFQVAGDNWPTCGTRRSLERGVVDSTNRPRTQKGLVQD